MSQKPVIMEQLKQILQLRKDGVAIREIVRHTGISRNAIKRYLALLEPGDDQSGDKLTNKQLADKAYDNPALTFSSSRRETFDPALYLC